MPRRPPALISQVEIDFKKQREFSISWRAVQSQNASEALFSAAHGALIPPLSATCGCVCTLCASVWLLLPSHAKYERNPMFKINGISLNAPASCGASLHH